jgi:hypothetical protein
MEVNTPNAPHVEHVLSTDATHITISGDPKIGDVDARDDGIFVEVLDKHDTVLHRARYDKLPVAIGNTYRADHVLDSEMTSMQSVIVERDESGALAVRGALAHQRFWAPGGMTQSWIVDPDAAFIVAGERVRIRTREYVPTRRTVSNSAIAWLGGWMALFAVAAALGITALQAWLIDIDGDRLSGYVTGALGIFGMIAIWSGVWAIVSRLNGKSSHFLAHLSLASLAVVVIWLIDFAFDSVAYAMNWSLLHRYGYVLFAVCIALLVWCHTRYIVRTRVGSAITAAVAIGIAVFAMQATTYFSLRGNLASSLTMNEARPPGWRFANGSSLEAFLANSAALEKRAEESKAEKPEGIDYGAYGE